MIRNRLLLGLMVVALAGLFHDGQASGQNVRWLAHKSSAGRFKVNMPGRPKMRTLTARTKLGSIKVHFAIVEVRGYGYVVAYNDFPAQVLKTKSTSLVFDQARNGAISNVKGRLISERNVKLGVYPGREMFFEISKGKGIARVRMFLIRGRLYQVMVVAKRAKGLPKNGTKFIESFAVTR